MGKHPPLEAGDAFVIPLGSVSQYTECSEDLELLEVALRGDFQTQLVEAHAS